ncbi:MAG: hypothetical protein R2877_02480 [Bdellovibrionota bacterium]
MSYWGTSKKLVAGLLAIAIFSTSIPQAHAKNYQTWEELDSSRQVQEEIDYSEIGEIGEACVDSFENATAYAGLANQLYIFPPHNRDNSKEHLLWSMRSKQLQREIASQKVDWTDLYWLRSEATQVYINQLIYNWRLQSEIFKRKVSIDVGELSDDPQVRKAITTSTEARKKIKEVPDSWDEKELIRHAKSFNAMVDGVNTICSETHSIYDRTMKVYNDSHLQNWETNQDLPILLGSKEENAFVDGGIRGIIRKRNDEMRSIAAWEAGLYTGVMSQTMFGKMYTAQTALRNHVGTFNQKSCVEYGRGLRKLPETKKELWGLLGSSYASIEKEYKTNLKEVIEEGRVGSTQDLLEDYIQSNPTSIQQALWAKPSRERAKSVCRVLQNFESSNSLKEGVAQMLAPVAMLTTIMTAGASSGVTGSIIAYSALVLNCRIDNH